MKKILSLAVLLMTALVGFTACNNDDDENNFANGDFTHTSWKGTGELDGAQCNCTVSFTNATEGVLQLSTKTVVAPDVEPLETTVFCTFTYAKKADAYMLNITNTTTVLAGRISTSPSNIEFPFSYDAKSKTLLTNIKEHDYSLSEVNYHDIKVPTRVPDNAAIAPLTPKDVACHWHIPFYLWTTFDMDITAENNEPKSISVWIMDEDWIWHTGWKTTFEIRDRKYEMSNNRILVYDEKGEDIEYKIFLLTFEERDEVFHTRHMYAEMYSVSGSYIMGQDFYQKGK